MVCCMLLASCDAGFEASGTNVKGETKGRVFSFVALLCAAFVLIFVFGLLALAA